MMTKYIKTATIEAEQFNETEWNKLYLSCSDPDEWEAKASKLGVDRYHGYFIIPKEEGDLRIHNGDWIATGINGEHWPIKDEIFKKTYKRLPVIPEYVAEDIELDKQVESLVWSVERSTHDTARWLHPTIKNEMGVNQELSRKRIEIYARAWLDGYEVEKHE